jgi:cytochrome P450
MGLVWCAVSVGSIGLIADIFPGHGIINSDGELWKRQRKAGLKFFAGSNLDTLIEDVLPNAYLQTCVELLQHAKSGQPLDLEAVLLDLTTAVVGRMAYDVSLRTCIRYTSSFLTDSRDGR